MHYTPVLNLRNTNLYHSVGILPSGAQQFLNFMFALMNVYKVIFNGVDAVSADKVADLQHGDIGLSEDKKNVNWFAVECDDPETAMENADLVIKRLWRSDL